VLRAPWCRLVFPTSDRLGIWLFSSGTTRSSLDNITSQSWSDAPCPHTTFALLPLATLLCLKRSASDKVLEAVVQDNGWFVILSKLVHSRGKTPGFEAIKGREHFRHGALSTHGYLLARLQKQRVSHVLQAITKRHKK